MTMRKLVAVVLATALAVGMTASSAVAHDIPEPKCEGETYAVVAAAGDAAMAELIASWQGLDTKCVVEPDDAKAAIESHEVVVLGGTYAVSPSAVSGLDVMSRLSGETRLDTAKAVIAWMDKRNRRGQAESASTGLGNAQDQRRGYVEKRFTVGTDLRPGVWRLHSSYQSAYEACWRFDGRRHEDHRIDVNGNEQSLGGGVGWPRNTFGLLEGDIVTLRGDPDRACTISWLRD